MIKIICDGVEELIKNKVRIEKKLDIKIDIKTKNKLKEVFIEGDSENEYIAEKVLLAFDFGFPFSKALLIKEKDYLFEVINIKNYTSRKDFKTIRARIIGRKGKTLKIFEALTDCFFEIKNNKVGIVGDAEHIKNAQEALISLIRGAKQRNVYSYLEKHMVRPVSDFGLKEGWKKTQKRPG